MKVSVEFFEGRPISVVLPPSYGSEGGKEKQLASLAVLCQPSRKEGIDDLRKL